MCVLASMLSLNLFYRRTLKGRTLTPWMERTRMMRVGTPNVSQQLCPLSSSLNVAYYPILVQCFVMIIIKVISVIVIMEGGMPIYYILFVTGWKFSNH